MEHKIRRWNTKFADGTQNSQMLQKNVTKKGTLKSTTKP